MTILVIGGTGFVGRALVELLIKREAEFVVLTRSPEKIINFSKKIPFIVGDLLDCSHMDISPFKQFINCSGELHNEKLMWEVHVKSIEGLLNKIKPGSHVHWIQLSSAGVYGRVRSGIVNENHSFSPVGPYEKTKAEGELMLKEYCKKNNLRYTIIRPTNVFGCDMPNKSLKQLVALINKRLFFYIGKQNNKAIMNYIHVEDVANGIVRCLDNEAAINQDFILSDKLFLTEFIQIITSGLGIKNSFPWLPERVMRAASLVSRIVPFFFLTASRIDALTGEASYSTEKATQLIDFYPSVGIARGLKDFTVDWYKKNNRQYLLPGNQGEV